MARVDPFLQHVQKFSESGGSLDEAFDTFIKKIEKDEALAEYREPKKIPRSVATPPPGSQERLEVYGKRLVSGESLYRSGDRVLEGVVSDQISRVSYSGHKNKRLVISMANQSGIKKNS